MYFLIKSTISFSFCTTAIPELLFYIVLNYIPRFLGFGLFTPESVYEVHELHFLNCN